MEELLIEKFDIDYDPVEGAMMIKRNIRMPILGRKINPLPYEQSYKKVRTRYQSELQ